MKKLKIYFQIIFVCVVATHFVHAGQQTYNGKSLSQLLWDAKWERQEEVQQQDMEAIRHVGTNGVPILLDLLSVKKANVKKILFKLHNANLVYFYNFNDDKEDSLEGLRDLGVFGFGILGTNAASAVSQIAKIFDEYDSETMFQTGQALTEVGPGGFFVLTNAISNTNAGVRDVAVQVIGKYGGGDPEVIRQLLIHSLQDPHPLVRLHVADFLRGKEPDLVIPVMIPLLSDNENDYEQCFSATEILVAYGPTAKSAAPKLFSIFTNVIVGTNQYLIKNLSGLLLNSLRKIDPNTAAKAEGFILNDGPLGIVGFGWTDTPLPNGKELIVGGFFQTEITTKADHIFSRAQLFDPITGKRTETGSMNVARYEHTATLLRNGKVLVAGGSDDKGHNLTSAELYDPTTGKWTVTGSMNSPHPSERMALQPNGKVLVYEGGFDTYPVLGHELFDPISGTWTVIPKEQERNRAWRSSPDQ